MTPHQLVLFQLSSSTTWMCNVENIWNPTRQSQYLSFFFQSKLFKCILIALFFFRLVFSSQQLYKNLFWELWIYIPPCQYNLPHKGHLRPNIQLTMTHFHLHPVLFQLSGTQQPHTILQHVWWCGNCLTRHLIMQALTDWISFEASVRQQPAVLFKVGKT